MPSDSAGSSTPVSASLVGPVNETAVMVPVAPRVNHAFLVSVVPSGAIPVRMSWCVPGGVLAGNATFQVKPPLPSMVPVYRMTGVECMVSV